MKKIFLSLLALCGMVAGFTLCSCGGGGGGSSLSGCTMLVQSGVGYYIQFGDKLQGAAGSYMAKLWTDAGQSVNLWIAIIEEPEYNSDGKLHKMYASVSADSIDYDDVETFLLVTNATLGLPDPPEDTSVETVALYAPAYMRLTPVENGGSVFAKVTWELTAIQAVMDENDEGRIDHWEQNVYQMPQQEVIGYYR